jgi:hypothetical protein
MMIGFLREPSNPSGYDIASTMPLAFEKFSLHPGIRIVEKVRQRLQSLPVNLNRSTNKQAAIQ